MLKWLQTEIFLRRFFSENLWTNANDAAETPLSRVRKPQGLLSIAAIALPSQPVIGARLQGGGAALLDRQKRTSSAGHDSCNPCLAQSIVRKTRHLIVAHSPTLVQQNRPNTITRASQHLAVMSLNNARGGEVFILCLERHLYHLSLSAIAGVKPRNPPSQTFPTSSNSLLESCHFKTQCRSSHPLHKQSLRLRL